MRSGFRCAVVALLLSATGLLAQTTIHVPADQPTIQAGINAAANGDTVLVAPGTYTENIDFKGKAITVTSGATSYAGAAGTVIQPATVGPLVRLASNEPNTTTLNGFTVQGAYSSLAFTSDVAGVLISGSSPTITNNIIQENIACGILVDLGGSPLIQGNHIWKNRFPTSNDPPYSNTCGSQNGIISGTGLAVYGGGIVTVQSNIVEDNSNVEPNAPSSTDGAGIFVLNANRVVLTDNIVENNATNGAGIDILYNQNSPAMTVLNQNLTDGLVFESQYQSTWVAINNTFEGITALYPDNAQGTLLENNIFAISRQNIYSLSCPPGASSTAYQNLRLRYNDIYNTSSIPSGCPLDATDLQSDPLFLNPGAGDYHTQRTSRVVAAGDINAPDIQATDLDGKNRTVCGTIDMGVYEVHPQPATVVTSSNNPSIGGSSVTFTARVPGNCNVPTGTVTFLDGASVIGTVALDASASASISTSTLTVGSHNITVTYPGDFNFDPSTSATLVQVVTGYPTATTLLQVAPNPAQALQTVSLSASVSSQFGNPPGAIGFYAGTTLLATATIAANVTAAATISTLTPGTYNITAVYTPTTDYASSTSATVVLVVNGAPTTTTLASMPNPSSFGQSVSFTATVVAPQSTGVPGGTVTFTDGATALGTVTLSAAGVASFSTSALSVGSHNITAVYTGSGNDTKSTSNTVMQVVGLDITNTTLSASPNPANFGQTVTLTATVGAHLAGIPTPAGTVVFSDQFGTLGTAPLVAGVASLNTSSLSLGAHNIVATYTAGSGYTASTSNAVAELIQAFDFTLGLSSTAVSLPAGDYHSLTATLTPLGSFRDTVALSCNSVPAYAQCVFQPDSTSLANGPQTVTLILNTSQIFEFGNQASTHDPARSSRGVLLGLLFLPLLSLCRPKGRILRRLSASLVLLIALASITALQGCGSGKLPATTAPGTYTVTVVATDTAAAITHAVTISLVVKP